MYIYTNIHIYLGQHSHRAAALASAFASAAENIHMAFPFEQACCVKEKKTEKKIQISRFESYLSSKKSVLKTNMLLLTIQNKNWNQLD